VCVSYTRLDIIADRCIWSHVIRFFGTREVHGPDNGRSCAEHTSAAALRIVTNTQITAPAPYFYPIGIILHIFYYYDIYIYKCYNVGNDIAHTHTHHVWVNVRASIYTYIIHIFRSITVVCCGYRHTFSVSNDANMNGAKKPSKNAQV